MVSGASSSRSFPHSPLSRAPKIESSLLEPCLECGDVTDLKICPDCPAECPQPCSEDCVVVCDDYCPEGLCVDAVCNAPPHIPETGWEDWPCYDASCSQMNDIVRIGLWDKNSDN